MKPEQIRRSLCPLALAELKTLISKAKGFESGRARLLWALCTVHDMNITDICKDHGVGRMTGHNLLKAYGANGLDALRYHCNPKVGLKRRKLSPQACQRAVEIASSEAVSLKDIMSRLIGEGLHSKNDPLAPETLAAVLKREGLSFQRTR